MNKVLVLAILGAMLLPAVAAHADTYDLTVYFLYSSGTDSLGNTSGPDTGFVEVVNNSANAFTGTISLSGTPNNGVSGPYCVPYNETFTGLDSGSYVLLSQSADSSNCGGWNGSLGMALTIQGTGADAGANATIYDSTMHSGFFSTSPCDNRSTDAFILQGGSPTGCDNGDGYELGGQYAFAYQEITGNAPEPASLALMGTGLIGLAGRLRKRFQK